MPLFPAHPAAVLPLHRLGLPLSALVAGSVAPDAPVYLPVPVAYSTTHSARGLFVDVLIGVVLLALWDLLLRGPVVSLLSSIRGRPAERGGLDRRGWLLAPLAVAVGAATHVLWDSATHDWGFIVERVDGLRQEYAGLALYGWLQHTSTVVGTLIVAAYCFHRWRRWWRAPPHTRPDRGNA